MHVQKRREHLALHNLLARQSLLTPDMDRWSGSLGSVHDMAESGVCHVPPLWPQLLLRQGPALWIFNDAQFSSKDFESICRLGVGGKRDQTRPWLSIELLDNLECSKQLAARKIGRFGLGFNSASFRDLMCFGSGLRAIGPYPLLRYTTSLTCPASSVMTWCPSGFWLLRSPAATKSK